MRKILASAVLMVIWSLVTVFAVTFGIFYDWPDFVHTDYGLPMVWATHTTSTFAGAADLWTVNMGMLAADLAVWLTIMIVAVVAIQALMTAKAHTQ